MLLLGMMLSVAAIIHAQEDSLSSRYIHRVEAGVRTGYVFPTSSFFRGNNFKQEAISNSLSTHLKYSFQFQPHSCADKIYGGVYQGVGISQYRFGNKQELGNPLAIYLFQGARIQQFNPRLSLNYEWNFGLSFGWEPYDYYDNPMNVAIGSRLNAYINANFYLNWMLSHQIDLTAGIAATHFSNGNTKYPNAGLNTIALQVGLVYNFNREEYPAPSQAYIPEFPKHISYDLTLFGSWRRKGIRDAYGDFQASPKSYTVLGFGFAPMYNTGYRSRVGISFDGVYDGSANLYTRPGYYDEFYTPPFKYQLALGVSARGEYVMPYFTIGLGVGVNVLHRGGDLKSFYQTLSLKTEVTRNSYLHVGYSLQDFHDPSFLMLGMGYRFNNLRPVFHRKR